MSSTDRQVAKLDRVPLPIEAARVGATGWQLTRTGARVLCRLAGKGSLSAKVIREAKPDLVALQEVDQHCGRSENVDQTAEIARLTGLTGIFGKAMDFDGGAYGQAILSRHPLTKTRVHALPGEKEPRIAFEATVVLGEKSVRFMTVHLGLTEKERHAQAETVAKTCPGLDEAIILCGDFNDSPDSRTLRKFPIPWVHTAKDGPPLTCPAKEPKVEIDFILTKNFKWFPTVTVLPEAVASDHRPLLPCGPLR